MQSSCFVSNHVTTLALRLINGSTGLEYKTDYAGVHGEISSYTDGCARPVLDTSN